MFTPQYDNNIVPTSFQNIYFGCKCVAQSDYANFMHVIWRGIRMYLVPVHFTEDWTKKPLFCGQLV